MVRAMIKSSLCWLGPAILVAASCAPRLGTPGAAAPPAAGARAPAPLTSPALRLPPIARPTHYEAELNLDPAREDFFGTISIDLTFLRGSDTLWLNADELTVDAAELIVGGERLSAQARPAKRDFLALIFPRVVAPGPARVVLKYRGKMHRNDGDGIYPVKEGDDWYLFTQFEATSARRAFPCFDEPGYKVPWRLTLHTKQALAALSNTPIESETPEGPAGKITRFAETRPLPSYLIAFAVGPFDFADAGKSRQGVPIRIVVPRGRAADAQYPVEVTRPILARLEDELGTAYPFAKLDLVAVPVFNAGAMENPGLITFRHSIILSKPDDLTRAKQQRYALVAAHELAHMWFGDLVTHAWWDDIWLNESFATWMEDKVIARWKPEWDWPILGANSRSAVMGQDSLDTARMIRQPIDSKDDIKNAFDGITYQKGAAVLAMIERWVGEGAFSKGVRTYLAKHAWANATYDDFVSAIGAAAGRDVHGVFDSFVRQSGVPQVSMALTCTKAAAPRVTLTQQRYAPLGSRIDTARTWHVPVCIRYAVGAGADTACTLLTERSAAMTLDQAKGCPAWVKPNHEGVGYYRSRLDDDLLGRLLGHADKVMSVPERLTLVGDVEAQVQTGALGKAVALGLAETLARSANQHLVKASMGILQGVGEMLPESLQETHRKFLRVAYGERARALGWRSRSGEDDDTKELRAALVALVGGEGEDATMQQEATALAGRWLDDPKTVEPEMVDAVLSVAARRGDGKLYERLHAEARKAVDRTRRTRLLAAMAQFAEASILQMSMQLSLTDEFEMRDAATLISAPFQRVQTRAAAYAFFKQHFDEITARLPAELRGRSVTVLASLCDDGRRAEIEHTFAARAAALAGGTRVMAQTMEQMGVCAANRQAQTPSVIEFFQRHR